MKPHRLILLLLIAVTVAAFWRAVGCGFVNYDDPDYVTANPMVQQGLTAPGVNWALGTIYTGYWHPLTWLSLMLDTQVWGTGPRGYHLDNVLYHAAAVALLFLALRSLTGATWRSGLVAAIFAVHPLRVESVAWVSERKDVLSGCLVFAALLAYAAYARRPRWRSYLLVTFLFAMGLLAKPIVVTLPFLLLLLDVWPLRRLRVLELPPPSPGAQPCPPQGWGRLILEKLPMLALTAWDSIATYGAQADSGVFHTVQPLTLAQRLAQQLANVPTAYVRYLGKMVWFGGLTVDYPRINWALWQVGGATAMLLLITAAALICFRSRPWLGIGWLWYLGMLVPVSGIVQLGHQSIADRYTYLPTVGLLVALAWSLPASLAQRPSARLALGAATAAVIAGLSIATWWQIGYWRDGVTLFEHAVNVVPGNVVTLTNLGAALDASGREREALARYQEAVTAQPKSPLAQTNLGEILLREGQMTQALDHLRRAEALRPDRAPPHDALGTALVRAGKVDEAITEFRQATDIDPTFVSAYRNLGSALALQGKYREALEAYHNALDLTPDDGETRLKAADAIVALGRADQALALYNDAVRLQPDSPTPLAHRGACLLKLGRLDDAIADLQRAADLGPRDPALLTLLAQALAARQNGAASIRQFQAPGQLSGNADTRPPTVPPSTQAIQER